MRSFGADVAALLTQPDPSAGGRSYAPGVAAPNWFDADHVSTEIPEHHPGQLTANVGEVEHSIGGK